MVLDGIDVFAEVVEARSFSLAARRLGMPTSTVSAKVARLEQQLGVTLLLRTTRQVSVTSAGRAYYDRCVRALAMLSDAERELSDISDEPQGTLKITTPADLAQSVLVPMVTAFLRRYPQTSVDLIVTNRRVDLIGEGIDLAVRIGPMPDSTLVARKFLDVRVGLWASEEYLASHGTPRTIEDLADHAQVRMARISADPDLLRRAGDLENLDYSGRLSTDDVQSCRAFIESGAGIGLLPDFIRYLPGKGQGLVRVLPHLSSDAVPAFFVYPAQRYIPLNVRAFIDLAKGIDLE